MVDHLVAFSLVGTGETHRSGGSVGTPSQGFETMSESNQQFDSAEPTDEQWEESALAQYDTVEESSEFRDSAHIKAGESLSEAHGEKADFETPEGGQASVAGEVVGETREGQPVVGSSAAGNADAANDGKTAAGIGTEFGVWGREANELPAFSEDELKEMTHMTLATLERAAALEAELNEISTLAVPARDGAASESEVEARQAKRLTECRKSLSELGETRVSLSFDFFSDDDEWSRELAREAKDRDAGQTSAPSAATSKAKHRPFGHGAYTETAQERSVGRWADETRSAPLMVLEDKQRKVLKRHDLSFNDRDTVEKLTAELYERVRDEGGLDVPGVDLQQIEGGVEQAVRENGSDELAALLQAAEDAFHPSSQSLETIEATWPGCTARVEVVELYEPNQPTNVSSDPGRANTGGAQKQVAKVTDVSPLVDRTSAGSEFAKVTVWKRADTDVTLREGDVVRIANPEVGRYANQLTFAVTSSTHLTVERRGTGPATTWRDSLFTQSEGGLESHNPAAAKGNKPSQSSESVLTTRYRRPSDLEGDSRPNAGPDEWIGETMGRDALEQFDGCGVTYDLTDDWVPEWFQANENTRNAARLFSAEEVVEADEMEDAASRAMFLLSVSEVETESVEFSEAAFPSAEGVLEVQVTPSQAIRVYSGFAPEVREEAIARPLVVRVNTEMSEPVDGQRIEWGSEWEQTLVDTLEEQVEAAMDSLTA